MTTAEIQSLLQSVNCYGCVGLSTTQMLNLALMRQWLLSLNPNEDVSFENLNSIGSCVSCYGASQYEILEIALLSEINFWSSAAGMALASFVSRASITDGTQQAALRTLVEGAVSNGWWDKCDLIYPFVGGNATAHAQNLKSANFTITWAGTVTHDANGITGNGTNGYGNTGYNFSSSSLLSQNSAHGSIYRRTIGTAGRYYFGGHNTNGIVAREFGGGYNCEVNAGLGDTFAVASALGFLTLNRIDAAQTRCFYNSTLQLTASRASAGVGNVSCFICAYSNSGSATGYSDANLSGFTIGSGLTLSEWVLMSADWQTFQTALGRQV